ncbi:unnamed protein product, partial [Rotaria sordida]
TICEALDSNKPVVVIKEEKNLNHINKLSLVLKESGRVADLIAELHTCYTESKNGNDNVYPTRLQTCSAKSSSKETKINKILTKAQGTITGLHEVIDNLCRVLNEHKQLVTIFKFDSKRHHGNLEDAILVSLFN